MTQTYNYNVAQICEKGHLITDQATEHPEWTKPYCDKCGAKTLTTCGHCKKDIRGVAIVKIPIFHEMPVPSNCEHCGKNFPWNKQKLPALPKFAWKPLVATVTLVAAPLTWCYGNVAPVKEAIDKQVASWIQVIQLPKTVGPAPIVIEKSKP